MSTVWAPLGSRMLKIGDPKTSVKKKRDNLQQTVTTSDSACPGPDPCHPVEERCKKQRAGLQCLRGTLCGFGGTVADLAQAASHRDEPFCAIPFRSNKNPFHRAAFRSVQRNTPFPKIQSFPFPCMASRGREEDVRQCTMI